MKVSRRDFLALAIAGLMAQTSSVSFADQSPDALDWPGVEWDPIAPEQAGWSTDALAQAHAYAQSVNTAALVIVHRGRMVDGFGDIVRKRGIHSIRKSLLSALIGIAVAENKIDLDATLASLGIDDSPPSLTDAEKQATVRQLLQARSGVYHPALYETLSEKQRRPARGSHAAGTFWYYNNWDFNVLGTIYERAVGESIFESFRQRIAGPIGMQDYRPQDGRYIRGADSMFPAYPFRMSARDLARFGLLYLRSGRWNTETIVPASWVAESTQAWSETYLHSGYGYLWWTGFPDRGAALMDLPIGGFWADGHNGQYVVVDPLHDLVVVHQTDADKVRVTEGQMGRLMRLIYAAAHVSDPATDPVDPKG
ncbi:serine hydrolase domain-containing protein [Paraburkholderia megapolitana]|uniref:CubicO group peptidase, beta-lactamase class C family n=1 Tax=Paraburkholderia megapolitana TaxID=420953 RepID=A0A1I3EBA0_9BURK|nr:serine hydrolase [Paraburkholderia megapolitana]SFH96244.1 CubicO group peptidase, beta-lactamase class C family [Paraburkholderia megapolitana]